MATTTHHKEAPRQILAIPYPLPGHITPLFNLCSILASSSSAFSITFLTTQRHQSHLLKILPTPPRIRFISIPDGLPLDLVRSWESFRALLVAFGNLRSVFEPVLEDLVSTGPPIVCILSDVHLGWTQDVADKLGVPRVAFWVSLAAECKVYCEASRLISAGHLPFKAPESRSWNDDFDNLIAGYPGKSPLYHQVSSSDGSGEFIHIPGLPLLDRCDFPSFLQIEDSSDIVFQYFVNQTKRVREAYMVLVNSFSELEASIFTSIRKDFNLYPVGPLFLLKEKLSQSKEENLPNEDRCITWLDSRSTNSVLYVAFGTLISLPCAQVTALATGLEASQHAFLWALLPDQISGKPVPLPEGFLDRTKGRGLVVDWAPQTRVLRHPSVGGFLSHCGWNSVLESISMGVPIIGFPVWGDHPLICKLMVDDWGVGMRLGKTGEGFATREDVEKLTREMLEGEKGREVRKRCIEWSRAAKKAVESGGSSRATLEAFVEDMTRRSQK